MLNKNPKLMGEFINTLFQQNGLEETLILSELIKKWKEIFGENFAQNCEPIKLKNQTLTIKVHSSAWREEIKLRKEKLIDLINQNLSKIVVNELKLR